MSAGIEKDVDALSLTYSYPKAVEFHRWLTRHALNMIGGESRAHTEDFLIALRARLSAGESAWVEGR